MIGRGARKPELAGSLEKLKQGIDDGLKKSGLDYVDLWRLTMREQATHNSRAGNRKRDGGARMGQEDGQSAFTGISTHHRPWIAEAVAKYPQIEVIVTPYSAGSKEKPVGSMFEHSRNTTWA